MFMEMGGKSNVKPSPPNRLEFLDPRLRECYIGL